MLVVDDSALMRQILTRMLTSDPEIQVVGNAPDPYVAEEKIKALNPDVITLDIEMPRMDGLTFLEKQMAARPLPIVMVSSLTQKDCDVTMRALELGAVDFFPKPSLSATQNMAHNAAQIAEKVKSAARARLRRTPAPITRTDDSHSTRLSAVTYNRRVPPLIAIGASTGGTEAIREVLTALPADTPGIVIVQHMPSGFTTSFAKRLDSLCVLTVKEAEDGDRVRPGQVLIAPGNFHLSVRRSGSEYVARVTTSDPVNRHRPSVDVLFQSCAEAAGRNVVAAILTGMGDDGARGMRQMRDAGARTIAQDEATCVVYGMPREAVQHGGVEQVLPLPRIAGELLALAANISAASAA